jgi:hypothetical protein
MTNAKGRRRLAVLRYLVWSKEKLIVPDSANVVDSIDWVKWRLTYPPFNGRFVSADREYHVSGPSRHFAESFSLEEQRQPSSLCKSH